jgi:hypothetical protein
VKLRFVSVALVAALTATLFAGAVAPVQAQGGLTQTVTGVCTLASGEAGTFAGTLTITRFVRSGSQILAQGTLSGTCTGLVTGATQTINQAVTVPITIVQATCTILRLDVGPIHLELLGLVVDIAPIHILITGQSGTLLGGLLCGLANALSGGANLRSIVLLLNQILAAL